MTHANGASDFGGMHQHCFSHGLRSCLAYDEPFPGSCYPRSHTPPSKPSFRLPIIIQHLRSPVQLLLPVQIPLQSLPHATPAHSHYRRFANVQHLRNPTVCPPSSRHSSYCNRIRACVCHADTLGSHPESSWFIGASENTHNTPLTCQFNGGGLLELVGDS